MVVQNVTATEVEHVAEGEVGEIGTPGSNSSPDDPSASSGGIMERIAADVAALRAGAADPPAVGNPNADRTDEVLARIDALEKALDLDALAARVAQDTEARLTKKIDLVLRSVLDALVAV